MACSAALSLSMNLPMDATLNRETSVRRVVKISVVENPSAGLLLRGRK
jgi:hypothetical protein